MSAATISSTQPVTKHTHSFGRMPALCQKRNSTPRTFCSLLPVCLFFISALAKRLWQWRCPHAGQTLTGFRLRMNHLQADYIDYCAWFPRWDGVAANYLSHQILCVKLRNVNLLRPVRFGAKRILQMYALNQTGSRSVSEIWKVIWESQSELKARDTLEVTGCFETAKHIKYNQLYS